tara:strand:+ start:116 stop:478 length:363 start_codon:yes stop_codon:yes gene_type:complete
MLKNRAKTPLEINPDMIILFIYSKFQKAMIEKSNVSKLITMNIVKKIRKNKNLTWLDINSKTRMINKESKNNITEPTNKSIVLLLKIFVDILKESPETLFKFHVNDCMSINITRLITNKP